MSEPAESPVVSVIKGRFRTEGPRVYKDGDERLRENGMRSISLSVPVCEVWEHLKDRNAVATMIADALNAQAAKEV